MEITERRKFPRVQYPCEIKVYKKPGGEVFLTYTENISCGGLCTSVPIELGVDSVVALEIDLKDKKPNVNCSGTVVWCFKRLHPGDGSSEVFDLGIEFIDIKEEDRARIKKIVDSHLKI